METVEAKETRLAEGKGEERGQVANLGPVAPLEASANRWVRGALASEKQKVGRKVKALLNKLTMEKFDSISDQIIEWANKSEGEKDGRSLACVTRLVFEHATKTPWSEMYARLCRKMMETISPKVQDNNIRNAGGRHISGGQLFRKRLLSRCQEEFERGWAVGAAASAKAPEDVAIKRAAKATSEFDPHWDAYYAAQEAKRQGLGLVQFVGELYRLQMLTERIMHECIKKLLNNVNPGEGEIESLCRLLATVGKLLDNPKARAHMDIYFTRLKESGKNSDLTPRIQLMLRVSSTASSYQWLSHAFFFLLFAQDLIELRERKWIPRNRPVFRNAIAQLHEEVIPPTSVTAGPLLTASIIGQAESSSGEGSCESYPRYVPQGPSAGWKFCWRARWGTTSR